VRPLFQQVPGKVLRVLAIAPDGEKNPRGFNQVRDAADKLAAIS
jgi:hypothetical protein